MPGLSIAGDELKGLFKLLKELGVSVAEFRFENGRVSLFGMDASRVSAVKWYADGVDGEGVFAIPIDRVVKWLGRVGKSEVSVEFKENRAVFRSGRRRLYVPYSASSNEFEDVALEQIIESVDNAALRVTGKEYKQVVDTVVDYPEATFEFHTGTDERLGIVADQYKGYVIVRGEDESGVKEEAVFGLEEINDEFSIKFSPEYLKMGKYVVDACSVVDIRFDENKPLVMVGSTVGDNKLFYVVAPRA